MGGKKITLPRAGSHNSTAGVDCSAQCETDHEASRLGVSKPCQQCPHNEPVRRLSGVAYLVELWLSAPGWLNGGSYGSDRRCLRCCRSKVFRSASASADADEAANYISATAAFGWISCYAANRIPSSSLIASVVAFLVAVFLFQLTACEASRNCASVAVSA